MSAASSALRDLSNQLAAAVERGARSLVSVHARPDLPSTGIHWRDGLIVTTNGTVKRDQDITVSLPNGNKVEATLQGRDPSTDIAVLRIGSGQLPIAELAESGELRPGHLVLALARLDPSGPRASFGAVSAVGGSWRTWRGGTIARLIQSDLNVYPGFGGGPLIDADGAILGLNSGGLSRPFATTIPPETVDRVLESLVSRGYVPRGWLGAGMQAVDLSPRAAELLTPRRKRALLVTTVEADGPAANGGLQVGDLIVAVAGAKVEEPEQVLEALSGDVVGTSLRLDLLRGGKPDRVDVLLGERPRRR